MSVTQRDSKSPPLLIRVHLTDGSIHSYSKMNETEANEFWEKLEPSRLFAQTRLVVAGAFSKSVFNSCHVARVDFIRASHDCWSFPAGASDVVELTEDEFRKNARLDEPQRMAKREQPTPVGDLLVSFLQLHMAGGRSIFAMVEVPVKLPIESQSFMQFLLSGASFHMRLPAGGVGFVNLGNLLGYTVYPGVAQVPADAWIAEPTRY